MGHHKRSFVIKRSLRPISDSRKVFIGNNHLVLKSPKWK